MDQQRLLADQKPKEKECYDIRVAWFLGFIILLLIITTALITIYFLAFPIRYYRDTKMIEMRDGVRLYTEIYTPVFVKTAKFPVLLIRSPYDISLNGDGHWRGLSQYQDLLEDGYFLVIQNIRGRGPSEGTFEMFRPPSIVNGSDETTDAYDTVQYLVDNLYTNGNVGIFGISYAGWTTLMAALNLHPAVKAISPQAPPESLWIGDDFFHNGALRLTPTFGYSYAMDGEKFEHFDFNDVDVYDYFMDVGPIKNVNKDIFHDKFSTWNGAMNHPNYDSFWQQFTFGQYYKNLTVPSFVVGGWFDAEDFYGTNRIFDIQEILNSSLNYLMIGPWVHSGWQYNYSFAPEGRYLGPIEFGSNTSVYFKELQREFFKNYLYNGGQNITFSKIVSFRTGENKWYNYSQWPKKTNVFYLNHDGILSPNASNSTRCYKSDPSDPTPYMKKPINGFWDDGRSGKVWKAEDQRFTENRTDVLRYNSETLEIDVVMTGSITATIFAAVNGSDIDWYVKVVDVFPDGFEMMVADRGIRGKFRDSFEVPTAIKQGEKTEFHVDLLNLDHAFLKGHKIMIHIQNFNFPLHDRNPQKFVNIPEATESDFTISDNCVFGDSYITFNQ